MTTTKLIDRSRNVVAMYGSKPGHGSLHLALAIMLASGLRTAADIANAFKDSETDGVIVNPLAPALPIESTDMYPDSVAVLDDGSLLICDALLAISVGDAYRDQVSAPPSAEDIDDSNREGTEAAREAASVEDAAEATGKTPAEVEPGDVEAFEGSADSKAA